MILNSNGILELGIQVNRMVVGEWKETPELALYLTQAMVTHVIAGKRKPVYLRKVQWRARPGL